MMVHVNFVHSKDAQKQLAQTSKHTHSSEMMPTRVKVQSQNTGHDNMKFKTRLISKPPDNYFKSDATTDKAARDQKMLMVKRN